MQSPIEDPDDRLLRPMALRSRVRIYARRASTTSIGLFVLALLLVAYLARSFLLPIVVALLAYLLLVPVVRALKRRLRIPEALGAALILVPLVGGMGITVYQLSAPAGDWLARAPDIIEELQVRLRSIRKPVEDVAKTAESVQELATGTSKDDGDPAPVRVVQVNRPGFTFNLFDMTTTLIASAGTSVILLYFLLASGDTFLRKFVLLTPSDKAKTVEIVQCIERDISRYFGTVTVINIFLGVAVGIAMAVLGMPNPALWAVMACVSNFVPYMGAMVGVCMISLVSFITYPTLGMAIVPPLSFLALTVLESELITPFVLGRRFFMHPVVIFVGLLFWTFLWGIPGALLAVPLLFMIKVVCERVDRLKPLAEFMSSERTSEPALAEPVPSATI